MKRKKRYPQLTRLLKGVCLFMIKHSCDERWPCNQFGGRVCGPLLPKRSRPDSWQEWPEQLEQEFTVHPERNVFEIPAEGEYIRKIWSRLRVRQLHKIYLLAMKELKKELRITTVQVSWPRSKWNRRRGYYSEIYKEWYYQHCPTILTALAAV